MYTQGKPNMSKAQRTVFIRHLDYCLSLPAHQKPAVTLQDRIDTIQIDELFKTL